MTDRMDQYSEVRAGDKDHCTAILLAAGKGSRMGGDTRKQYLDLEGRPLFTYALAVMNDSDLITDVVVTVPAGDERFCKDVIGEFGLGEKVRGIIPGGSERCFSVAKGLESIDWPCDYVFIHDAARPFIDHETIRRLYEEVKIVKACVAGVPSKDTVKITDKEGYVSDTPNRSSVWIVQTPQVFEFSLIKNAYERMLDSYEELAEKGVTVTDDAMVVESFSSERVRLVMASYRNIKVTTPEDLVTASAYIRENH